MICRGARPKSCPYLGRCAALLSVVLSTFCPVQSTRADDTKIEQSAAFDAAPTDANSASEAASDTVDELALSDVPDGYRELVQRAIEARQQGRLAEARALLEQAHRLFPNARTLRGLGVLAMDQRHYPEAARLLESALACEVRPLDEALQSVTQQLLARARQHLGQVRLTVRPANAQVTIDDKPEPVAASFSVAIGDHRLTASAAGFISETRVIHVRPFETQHVQLDLHILPSVPEQKRRSAWRSPWLWGAVSALVVGGVVAGVLSARRQERGYDDGEAGFVLGKQ